MNLVHNILSLSGKPWAVQAAGRQFVYFDYNPVGDNIKAYSEVANDWERLYTYDRLGRRESYAEGNLHETYIYDGGNLAELVQEWFENGQPQTKTTRYHYNAHRLDSVGYDDALTTIYHYDQYGRVDSLYDESGVMCCEYGDMGEVTQEKRIYALPFFGSVVLTSRFGYDSWGRMDSIVYPDNEIVKYQYDCGGQLRRMCNNSSYIYLDNVAYDRFGAKVSQTYGNGLVTGYAYDNTTRRLSQITVTDNGNNPYSDIQYTYDPVGNVTQVASNYSWLNNQSLTETFTYDASDQLVSASETQNQSYQLEVNYGNWGRIDDYSLLQTELWSGATTHDHRSFAYPNDPYNPQQAQTLFAPETHNGTSDVTYTFGINGSLRKREEHSPNPCTENYLFNSSANLKAYSYDGLDFAYYGYNAANTRTYKLSMLNQNQWVNGQPQPIQLQMQQAMFYPNAYLNFNQNGEYTKHYYNGSERIASRLGDMTAYIYADAGERLENRIMRLDALFREELGGMLAYEEPEQPAILGNRNGGTRELVSPPVEYEPFLSIPSLQPTGTPNDIFYYHMNHLGSTAFVTDQNQNVTQGFLYAPFGEITTEYVPLWQNGTLPKYSFNAKELDEETGMYYYEARYYKPPVFTSRDALMEAKPFISPYTYCRNNPIKYVDPDGKWEWDNDGNLIAQKGDNAWTMSKFLGTSVDNSLTILKRCGYSVNNRGILNLKIGDKLAKENLWVESKSNEGVVVNDGWEAATHYYKGNGEPADVGDRSTNQLISTDKFMEKHKKITSQSVSPNGYFSVDMTDLTFHIGRTGVDYSISSNGKTNAVTYTLFTNTNKKSPYKTDGFWDVNYLKEYSLGAIPFIKKWTNSIPDGPGPNLEREYGTPYPYKTRTRTYFYKPTP